MMRNRLQQVEDWFGRENYKSFYLAFLRVAISVWFLKELCISWPSLQILYGPKSFVVRHDGNILRSVPGTISFLRNHYMILVIVYLVVIFMNILGIGRWVTALLFFVIIDLFEKLNTAMVNGGDKMARLIAMYMIFASSYDYFVLCKSKTISMERKRMLNVLSNVAAYSLMLQLCLSYLCAGVGKFYNELWRNGEALYYAMSVEKFTGTSLNKYLVQNALFVKVGSYFTLVLEITFPFFVWVKKLRNSFLVSGILMHLAIYIFLMIYGFEIVFIMLYGLFLTNDEIVNFINKCKSLFKRTSTNHSLITES
jgi:hypothetical protein